MCYIDYSTAFGKIQHDKLEGLDLGDKDLRSLRNLYWEQTASMRIDNAMSDYIKIKRGVRQEYVFSPNLFHL